MFWSLYVALQWDKKGYIKKKKLAWYRGDPRFTVIKAVLGIGIPTLNDHYYTCVVELWVPSTCSLKFLTLSL